MSGAGSHCLAWGRAGGAALFPPIRCGPGMDAAPRLPHAAPTLPASPGGPAAALEAVNHPGWLPASPAIGDASVSGRPAGPAWAGGCPGSQGCRSAPLRHTQLFLPLASGVCGRWVPVPSPARAGSAAECADWKLTARQEKPVSMGLPFGGLRSPSSLPCAGLSGLSVMWKDAESGHGGRKNTLEALQELGEENPWLRAS